MKWTPMRLVAVSAAAGAMLVAAGGGTALAFNSSHAAPAAATAPAKPAAKATPAPAKTTAPAPQAPVTQAPAAQGPAQVTIINTPPAAGYIPVPEYNAPSYVSASEQVVQQYFDDLNSQNFAAAWALGGASLNGNSGYPAWVAGYDTTVPGGTSLSTWSYYPDANAVQVTITALQTDGSTKVFQGSYTVAGGVITGASIVQVS